MATNNALNLGLSGSTGTGSFVGSNSPTLVTPALGTPSALVLTNANGDPIGTTTNDNATALHKGEFVTNSGSGVSLTTDALANICTISLTAGDWDVYGLIGFVAGAAVTRYFASSSTVSATEGANGSRIATFAGSGLSNSICPIGYTRYSLASTTTIYLVAMATFATSTVTGSGSIFARRAR